MSTKKVPAKNAAKKAPAKKVAAKAPAKKVAKKAVAKKVAKKAAKRTPAKKSAEIDTVEAPNFIMVRGRASRIAGRIAPIAKEHGLKFLRKHGKDIAKVALAEAAKRTKNPAIKKGIIAIREFLD